MTASRLPWFLVVLGCACGSDPSSAPQATTSTDTDVADTESAEPSTSGTVDPDETTTSAGTTDDGTGTSSAGENLCPDDQDVTFEASVLAIEPEGNPRTLEGLTTGDFNHDGLIDIVAASHNTRDVWIFLASGPGTFAEPQPFDIPGRPSTLLAGSIADDDLDLIVQYDDPRSGEFRLELLRGRGDGTFMPGVTLGEGLRVLLGDLDGDGDLDVVASVSRTLVRYMAEPSETFGSATAGVDGLVPRALGDFNGDLVLDLVAQRDGMGLVVEPGNGDGTFGTAVPLASDFGASVVSVGDLDGDQALDILVDRSSSSVLEVYYGSGSLSFSGPTMLPLPQDKMAQQLQVADLGGDGTPDLVGTLFDFSGAGNSLFVMVGDGAGGLSGPTEFACPAGCSPWAMSVANFDDDCFVDVALAGFEVDGPDGPVLFSSRSP